MNTLWLFPSKQMEVPTTTAWCLSDLQELYTKQSPQRLKLLREYALIASAASPNRIEDMSVVASRIRELLMSPKPFLRDRDEWQMRGYRDSVEPTC